MPSKLMFSVGAPDFRLGAIAQESPPEAEAFCRHYLHIHTSETIKT